MKNNRNDPKLNWRIWLIKKLLNNQNNNEDILKILSENSDLKNSDQHDDLDDNNEDKLIRNIFNLSKKNVEDVMVPRAEIVAIKKKS